MQKIWCFRLRFNEPFVFLMLFVQRYLIIDHML